MLEIEDSQLSK